MRIKHLKIHNFRSIRDLSFECMPFMALLGPNNHGKSNILSALEFGLSTSVKPVEQDFFFHRSPEDNEMWIEITFHELTDQEKNTFKRYVLSDDTLCIRKTARMQNGEIEIAYNGYVEQANHEWLRADKTGEYATRDKINETPLKDLVPPSGRLSKQAVEEAQQQYIEQHRSELNFTRTLESGPLLGQKNVGGGVLPDFYLIPAVRDLTEEIKVKTTSTFGRLLNRAVQGMAEKDPRFIEAKKQLESVFSSLNTREAEGGTGNRLALLEESIEKELLSWGVRVNIEVTPPELERLFELGTDVHLDDGVKTTADRKGHGLQRAVMFALLRAWAKALRSDRKPYGESEITPRKQSDTVIFTMEEPELFLHPHAQRRLAASLREIAETPEHQVFLCTHSTYFVDLDHYKEMAVITKACPEKGSCVRQCTRDLFEGDNPKERKDRFHMARWINPDRGEMFFAQRVVFVEGETEKVVLPYLAEKMGVFNPDISTIDCGSKHNLPLYITIAEAFGTPYLVVHDEDPVPEPIPTEWTEEKKREKQRTFALNEEIEKLVKPPLGQVEVLSPDFEKAAGVSKSQSAKKGKALVALDHFDSMDAKDIPERLRRLVNAAYGAEGAEL
jgi:CRISPR-associated exonuclease Cas4